MGNNAAHPNGFQSVGNSTFLSNIPYSDGCIPEGRSVENGWTDLGQDSNRDVVNVNEFTTGAIAGAHELGTAEITAQSLNNTQNKIMHPCADIVMKLSPFLSVGHVQEIIILPMPPLRLDLFEYSFSIERDILY